MEIATLGLVSALVITMFYLAHRVGKLEGCFNGIEKRMNHIETQFKAMETILKELIKKLGG